MSRIGFRNISCLVTNSSSELFALSEIAAAGFVVEAGRVVWIGQSTDLPSCDEVVDVAGRAVIPGFVDSHAHLVFAGDRVAEFNSRMKGERYQAGGIQTTVTATRAATDAELRSNVAKLASELLENGVTTFETKTGYGLTVEDELRALRIAAEFTDEVTLLAAHVVPAEFAENSDAYVDLIINQIIPRAIGIAKWFDVFCEAGAFNERQTERLLSAAKAAGFGLRLHANQLTAGVGIKLGVRHGVASVDHCSHTDFSDINALRGSGTVVTLLPGAEFSTRSEYPDAHRFVAAGIPVAIATDCNPGSSYTTSMSLMIALAVREMRMTPAEAVWAATKGGAMALKRDDIGWLGVGAKADFVILKESNYAHLAYRPGVNLISEVWQTGELVKWEQ